MLIEHGGYCRDPGVYAERQPHRKNHVGPTSTIAVPDAPTHAGLSGGTSCVPTVPRVPVRRPGDPALISDIDPALLTPVTTRLAELDIDPPGP